MIRLPRGRRWVALGTHIYDSLTSLLYQVVNAVHEKGSFIYLQLWAFGRAARFSILPAEFQGYPLVAPSPIPLSSHPDAVPHEMTTDGTLSMAYELPYTNDHL